MAKVTFKNVSKHFGEDTIALQNFNLTVEDGELLVLVGPSGCGKSTALRLLAGLDDATEGKILIDDKVVNQNSPQQRNVAMVFQNYALYPHMSVRANLEFPLRMTHMPTHLISEKVTQIAQILDLTELLARKPKQLSGGQRQRVAMGRALVRNPSVFLLDEPLSNLDAKLRAQIRADIAQLQKRLHKTTLYVTHDQVEAMTLGNRVAVMNAGKLQQVGTPEELYQHPQNVFVARFIGSPGMNIIAATLFSQIENGFAVRAGNQTLSLSFSSQADRQTLSQYINQTLLVGIRPEAFHTSQINNSISITVKISAVEYLGHESLVYFQLPETNENHPDKVLIARLEGQFNAPDNDEAVFYVDPETIYLFNPDGKIILG